MNLSYISRILGFLLMIFSASLIFPSSVAYYYSESDILNVFLSCSLVIFIIGLTLFVISSDKKEELRTKDGFLITVLFWGVLTIFGFATGPAFYYAKAVRGIDVPSWVFFTASTATFGAAVVGISYGVLSASWDPRREGSFWGFAEFKENVPIVVSTIMGKARGEVPLEWDDETDEDF